METIYILERYAFYDGGNIVMISESYHKVKECFNKLVEQSKTGYGYTISRYITDREYSFRESYDCIIERVEIDYDGNKKVWSKPH